MLGGLVSFKISKSYCLHAFRPALSRTEILILYLEMFASVGVMFRIPIDSFVELLKMVVKLKGICVVLNDTSNVRFSPLPTNRKSSSLALIVR